MAEEKQIGTCERCKKMMPVVGDNGIVNLHMIGGQGWGFPRELICTECKLAANASRPTKVGFGQ